MDPQSTATLPAAAAAAANRLSNAQRQKQFHSSAPVVANYSGDHFTIGGGVAIFHVASGRVVLCFHSRDKVWFLPKGRRDVNEDTEQGAEREGFEESGYRNRLLPLPFKHRQPQPRIPVDPRFEAFATEPVWLQLIPQTPTSQYILYWYVAETLPPQVEDELNKAEEEADSSIFGAPYQYPPRYPKNLTLHDRIALEPKGYEPVRHENTSADEEEALYESYLLPVKDAITKLQRSVQSDVVLRGWEAINMRLNMELQ